MIKYSFSFTNEFGHNFKMENEVEVYPDIGNDEKDELSEAFNNFMNQIGYRFNNDYILMESLTEDEYNYLLSCLDDYREKDKT